MSPVIRVDDQVMDELKRRAIDLGLVFVPPNEVMRVILGLDKLGETGVDEFIDIEIRSGYTPLRWALIPFPKRKRQFFPGFKVNFELTTDIGKVVTHVTSAPRGTPVGDPGGGKYIQGGLRGWFDAHRAELTNGNTLRIEALEHGKRYKLSIIGKRSLKGV